MATHSAERGRILAVLGPTNTGKTHLAIERLVGHASGMIGFPLRLLARENYDRVVRLKGPSRVALVTGEEKIVPPHAAYFVCTVESMPLDRPVDFLAVDEIQLCADPERGHVFTHRLLHARGEAETLLLGAETIRGLIRRLVPRAEFVTRPRFSTLSHAGSRKLTRLPPRSAVVAFSAAEVYELAERIRRQRGGAAVVMGALSPRTRNAQVGMFQAGEVDHLVATDAIGMGLNMDIDHVAFARLEKFDGRRPRRLTAAEIAQIAGRAGRHMADGTFGTTAEAEELDEETIRRVEAHDFPRLTTLMWRNAELDLRSPALLLASLERRPPDPALRRTANADDHRALIALAAEPEILRLAADRAAVGLLWEVCQVPDFRKSLSDAHARLLASVFRQLRGPTGRLDPDWTARQVTRLDRTDGDIDTLIGRIADIRTWTYLAHRPDWLVDPRHWQERARAVEDRLSDALHDRLTQRFVDRRATVLSRRLAAGAAPVGVVTQAGEVLVEGEYVGQLDGFHFVPDPSASGGEARALTNAARRALGTEIAARLRRLEQEGDEAFALGDAGGEQWDAVLWHGVPVGRMAPGADCLAPAVRLPPSDLLEPAARDRIARRLERWLAARIAEGLAPLIRLRGAPLSGAARGVAFQLVEGLGGVARERLAPLLDALTSSERKALAALGVRIGAVHVFVGPALKPRAVAWRRLLWSVAHRLIRPAALPHPGSPSVAMAPGVPPAYYAAIGYAPAGTRAVRLDRLEALEAAAAGRHAQGPLAATADLAQIIGCPRGDLPAVLARLGYWAATGPDGAVTFHRRPHKARSDRRRGRGAAPRPDSPFAKLRALGAGGPGPSEAAPPGGAAAKGGGDDC